MAAPYQSSYPELGPSGALPTPRHPYFSLGDDGLGYEDLDEDTEGSEISDSIKYDAVDGMDYDGDTIEQASSEYDEDEDMELSDANPFHGLAELDANTVRVDEDFAPPSDASDVESEVSSSKRPFSATVLGDEGGGRRGSARSGGRGRGRGRGRGQGFGVGSSSQVGSGRGRGRGRRGRGGAFSDDVGPGRRKGKRGPRAPAEPSQEFKEFQAKATTAFLEKSYDTALEYAKKAVQINPEIFAAHSLLSQIYFEKGMKEESVGVLWSGAHTKRDAGVWWEVANRTLELGVANNEATRKQLLYCYNQIIEIDSSDYEARKGRMDIFIELDYKPRAIRECLAMLKSRSHDLELLQILAGLCVKLGDPEKAKGPYEAALKHYKTIQSDGFGGEFSFSDLNIYLELFAELNDWSGGLFALKSIARWLCGRKDEAFWDECLHNDCEWDLEDEPRRIKVPGFKRGAHRVDAYGEGLPPEVRCKLGLFRLNLSPDNYYEAMYHFEFFDPDDGSREAAVHEFPDLFRDIGDALRFHSHPDEALRFFDALGHTMSIPDTKTRAGMADCYRQLSQWRLAAVYYETVIEDNPHNIEARVDLAKVYEELGDSIKAFEHVSYAIKVRQANMIAAEQGDTFVSISETADLSLPDPIEAAGIPATSTSVHLLLNKLAASMPKRPYKKSVRSLERHRISTSDTKEMYSHMLTLLPDMRAGEKSAESEWTDLAAKMIENFKAERIFYPPERYVKFLGYSAEARRRANWKRLNEPLTEVEIMAERLQTALGENVNLNDDPQFVPDEYNGVYFRDWLDVFCEYAFRAARNKDDKLAYDTLTDAGNANVFYHNEDYLFHVQVCLFTCALLMEDEEKLCATARWFWKQYPFATDTFHLFAALNRLYHGETNWYNSGPTQKFVLRTIKHMDFALMSEENRKRFNFSVLERVSVMSAPRTAADATPDNPHGLTTLDPALLTLYGHILATSSTYPSALHYYFRAYAIDPKNPLVVLSISVAYLQYSVKRQAENRHYLAMQGTAFFNEYKSLRLEQAKGLGRVRSARLKEEVEFNEGRMWNMLGLSHLAVAAYERCLKVDEADAAGTAAGSAVDDVRMTDAGDGWVEVGNADEQSQMRVAEPDFKREAAFALQTIHALGGDMLKARQLAERWLVF